MKQQQGPREVRAAELPPFFAIASTYERRPELWLRAYHDRNDGMVDVQGPGGVYLTLAPEQRVRIIAGES